jgi:hypothetical protein
MIYQERIEDWDCEVYMADVSRTVVAIEAASHTPRYYLGRSLAYRERVSKGETPMALSYMPPGSGLPRLSNAV